MRNLTIEAMIKQGSWNRPDSYMGPDHENTFSIGIGQSRDSDLVEQVNFEAALDRLGGESDYVEVIRDSHWACGWVEHIRISKTAPNKILQEALNIKISLEQYPLLDDDLYYERQNEEIKDHAQYCLKDAAKFLRRNSDLPEDLIEELAEYAAYEVLSEVNAYCGEIYFNDKYADKIISDKRGYACTGSELFSELILLNFGEGRNK